MAILYPWFWTRRSRQEAVDLALEGHRILSNAREQGVVKIGNEHETAETLALSDWIASQYRVRECLLTPVSVYYDDSDVAEQLGRRSVGIVAANHVGRQILATRAVTVGLGAGRTVAEMINAFSSIAKPDARVVSIVGASANDDGNGSYPLTLKFANALGGAPVLFPVPMTVRDARVHQALLREPAVAAARAVLESADFSSSAAATAPTRRPTSAPPKSPPKAARKFARRAASPRSPASFSTRRAAWSTSSSTARAPVRRSNNCAAPTRSSSPPEDARPGR